MRGTASDVVGMIADTRFMKTVSDKRTVTSAKHKVRIGKRSFFLSFLGGCVRVPDSLLSRCALFYHSFIIYNKNIIIKEGMSNINYKKCLFLEGLKEIETLLLKIMRYLFILYKILPTVIIGQYQIYCNNFTSANM